MGDVDLPTHISIFIREIECRNGPKKLIPSMAIRAFCHQDEVVSFLLIADLQPPRKSNAASVRENVPVVNTVSVFANTPSNNPHRETLRNLCRQSSLTLRAEIYYFALKERMKLNGFEGFPAPHPDASIQNHPYSAKYIATIGIEVRVDEYQVLRNSHQGRDSDCKCLRRSRRHTLMFCLPERRSLIELIVRQNFRMIRRIVI